jgi:hypothetical protein
MLSRRRVLTIGCLGAALLAVAVAVVGVAYATGKANDHKAARVALTVQRDKDAAATAAARQMVAAVKTQKAADGRVFRRVVEKMRVNRRKAVKASYEKGQRDGYASGNAAGYSSGNAAGQATGKQQGYDAGSIDGYLNGSTDGLIQGSDQLDCSDDPDVYWLPVC